MDARLDLGLGRRPGGGWDFQGLSRCLNFAEPNPLPANPSALIDSTVFDMNNVESVIACVIAARDNARQVREEISADMWEHINSLYLRLKDARAEGTWTSRPHYISRLAIEGVHLFQGITDATMGHGEGWQYIQVGRFLERASVTAWLIDALFKDGAMVAGSGSPGPSAGPRAQIEWAGLLRSCSAL